MRILAVGFLAFVVWSALSTYIYVCKIKGLCFDTKITQVDVANAVDTKLKPAVKEEIAIPKNIVIYFAFDKSNFTANAETDKYLVESNLYLAKNTHAMINITGHTDAVGTDDYNQTLGYQRAQSLQQYFERKGVLAKKILIDSKGEKEPVDNNNTNTGRANNRRTVVIIKK